MLCLARDRFGEKPLYYGWQKDTFIFGSELKALTQHSASEKEIEKQSIALLLKHGHIAANYLIWRNIYKFPAAHYLRLDANSREPGLVCYWSFKYMVKSGGNDKLEVFDEEAVSHIDALVIASINRQ